MAFPENAVEAVEGDPAKVVWATRFPPPHVRGNPSQARALVRVVDGREGSDRARAVLRVLCDAADGAGIAYPKIETLVRESGYSRPSVYRALSELVSEGLVEKYPTLRDPSRFERRRDPRARRGQGITIYRLGRALRSPAGLRDMDMTEHLGLVTRWSQNASVRLPKADRVAADGDCPTLADETPKRDSRRAIDVPATLGVSSTRDETPRTKERKELAVTGREPTLDEALREIALFELYLAPYIERPETLRPYPARASSQGQLDRPSLPTHTRPARLPWLEPCR